MAKKTKKKPGKGKKRAREEEDDDEEETPPVYLAHEHRDLNVLGHIHELRLDPVTDTAVTAMYSDMMGYKAAERTARTAVGYRPGGFLDGRIYGPGLQGVSGWIRRILAYKYYHDVDMKNAGPTILCQIAKKELGECPAILEEYARDRSSVFARVRAHGMPNSTDEVLKNLFLISMYGGKYTNSPHATGANQVLAYFEKQVRRTVRKLRLVGTFKEIDGSVTEAKKKNSTINETGQFLSRVVQQNERSALLAMADYFTSNGRVVGTLIHDGLLLERIHEGSADSLSHDLLRGAENAILSATSLVIELAEKPLVPTEADWVLYNGPKVTNKIAGPFNQQIELMVQHASTLQLVRSDGYVWSLHARVKGVFEVGDADVSFVNNVLGAHPVFRGADMKDLTAWFNMNEHPRFPLMTPDKFGHSIAFQNGYLDLETLEWNADKSPPLATKHFFDRFIDDELLCASTPLWDSLLESQLGGRSRCILCDDQAKFHQDGSAYCRAHAQEGSEHLPLTQCDMLEVLIGRLFYPVGKYDQWQVMPFLKGDANTGKSTIIDVVTKMFPIGTAGAITSNTEKTYGLEALENKRIITIPDLPAGFGKIISQGDFQSMLSGESVSVARKYKTAIANKPWTVPMIGAGNFLMDYKDSSGSLSRRLVVFPFLNLVPD